MSGYNNEPKRFSWNVSHWIASLPVPEDKRVLLLAIRWSIVLGVSVLTLSTGKTTLFSNTIGTALINNPWFILPVVVIYNLGFSLWVWRRRALNQTQIVWLIISDTILALLAIILTGNSGSLFYLLSCIPIIEIALVFNWQASLVLILTINIIFTGTVIVDPSARDPYATMLVIIKFFVFLLLGSLITLFSEQTRREDSARRQATQDAARATVLSEISLRLGKSGLNQDHILSTAADSICLLPDVAFSLVLLPITDKMDTQWQVTASSTDRHPPGQQVQKLDWTEDDQRLFYSGAGYSRPLPDFVTADGVLQLIGLRLNLLIGNDYGLLLFGRNSDQRLSEYEQIFLRSLILETDAALRNADLYAHEQEAVARLRRFDELRATFFSTIAHELKTPLTVLKTLVPSMSQLSQLPQETQMEISEIVAKNLTRLETLISDLLESTRLEADAVDLHRRPTNLVNRVQHVIDGLSPLISRKQRQIILDVAPDLPLVFADGKRVEQIISNLVNNANKFAPPESPIEIALQVHPQGVLVSVADSGPGVPPSERERIFEKYYIAVEDKALAGTGLGLFICRELVRLHNGHIWVESRPGGGSLFCFTLPLAPQETPTSDLEDNSHEKSV